MVAANGVVAAQEDKAVRRSSRPRRGLLRQLGLELAVGGLFVIGLEPLAAFHAGFGGAGAFALRARPSSVVASVSSGLRASSARKLSTAASNWPARQSA